MNDKISKSFEQEDLYKLVDNVIYVDRYSSISGSDESNIVLTFKVKLKEAAEDLIKFLDKDYGFILNTDITLTQNNKDYMVYLEIKRTSQFPKYLNYLLLGLTDLTGNRNWLFRYYKSNKSISFKDLIKIMPLTILSYKRFIEHEKQIERQLQQLQINARII